MFFRCFTKMEHSSHIQLMEPTEYSDAVFNTLVYTAILLVKRNLGHWSASKHGLGLEYNFRRDISHMRSATTERNLLLRETLSKLCSDQRSLAIQAVRTTTHRGAGFGFDEKERSIGITAGPSRLVQAQQSQQKVEDAVCSERYMERIGWFSR
ncbi:hypothetical protein ONS95_004878 [Cadophora gregata]|uniref:uncharacterized protein n=1 Tax=Cadophora gregata TaxID=51156 RepID=UPI0026DAEC4E|nr:uncharacterized protein ONS95_004878 [Cadophora gregata]KAK0104592.1 hypothetical protein ONS95_004878 [Cadophora gregata]